MENLQALKELQKQENELQLKKAQLLSNLKKEVGKEEFEETLQDLHIKKTHANKVMKIAQDYNTYSDNASLDQVILLQKLTIKERKEYLQNNIKDKALEEIENDIADIKANKKTKTTTRDKEIIKEAENLIKEYEIRNCEKLETFDFDGGDIFTESQLAVALLTLYLEEKINKTEFKNAIIKNKLHFDILDIFNMPSKKEIINIFPSGTVKTYEYRDKKKKYIGILNTMQYNWDMLDIFKCNEFSDVVLEENNIAVRIHQNKWYNTYCIYKKVEEEYVLIGNYNREDTEDYDYYIDNLKKLAELEHINFNTLNNLLEELENKFNAYLHEQSEKAKAEQEEKAREKRKKEEEERQKYREYERKFNEDYYSRFNLSTYSKPKTEEEKQIYKKIYKTAALKMHPDIAKDDGKGMQVLNQLKEQWGI